MFCPQKPTHKGISYRASRESQGLQDIKLGLGVLLQAVWFGWSYQEWSLLEGSTGKSKVLRASQTDTQGGSLEAAKPLKGLEKRSGELPAHTRFCFVFSFLLWLRVGVTWVAEALECGKNFPAPAANLQALSSLSGRCGHSRDLVSN